MDGCAQLSRVRLASVSISSPTLGSFAYPVKEIVVRVEMLPKFLYEMMLMGRLYPNDLYPWSRVSDMLSSVCCS